MNRTSLLLLALVGFVSAECRSQSVQREPSAVLEVGVAFDRSLTGRQSSVGPTVGVEMTPIEDRLELEAGVTPLFRQHSTEVGFDFLFKKPWTLSDRNEFMLGVGPEWVYTSAGGIQTNSAAIELVPDFMFWASQSHRVGWYLEPSYEYKLGAAHEHSVAIAGGLLIGVP